MARASTVRAMKSDAAASAMTHSTVDISSQRQADDRRNEPACENGRQDADCLRGVSSRFRAPSHTSWQGP